MSDEPYSITRTGWYRLISPTPKPLVWDITVETPEQHLGWRRCWAFVLTHSLKSSDLSTVWAIAYAMKNACEEIAEKDAAAAYEQGWRDACDDFNDQKKDPNHPIGERKKWPKEEL